MLIDLLNRAHDYPLAPAGGLFLAIVGPAILLGAPLPRWRQALLIIGIVAASVALITLTRRLTVGLPAPTLFAIGALVVAVALEAVSFPFVVRRVWSQGPGAVMRAALALVGAHFLLMAPAFGPLVVVLGLACMLNAAIAMMIKAMPDHVVWAVDGALKLSLGAMMLQGSPAVQQAISGAPA